MTKRTVKQRIEKLRQDAAFNYATAANLQANGATKAYIEELCAKANAQEAEATNWRSDMSSERKPPRMVYVPILGVSLPLINEPHVRAVRDLPCSVCGRSKPSEAHHPKGLGWGCGMKQKAPDITVIPLCNFNHMVEYHGVNRGRQYWEGRYGMHEEHLQKTLRLLCLPPLS